MSSSEDELKEQIRILIEWKQGQEESNKEILAMLESHSTKLQNEAERVSAFSKSMGTALQKLKQVE